MITLLELAIASIELLSEKMESWVSRRDKDRVIASLREAIMKLESRHCRGGSKAKEEEKLREIALEQYLRENPITPPFVLPRDE